MNIIDLLSTKEKRHISYKSLDKGNVLFHENDECRHIGIVCEGEVSIITYLDDGKEIVYNNLKEGELFGNNLLFSSSPYYKGDIIADRKSLVALINKDNLINLLQNNEAFLSEYLKRQSDFSKTLNNRIKLLSIDSAEERFMFYMHENRNRISYDSISSLARQMFLSRETLSRLLSKLDKNNSIIRENKVIILK